MHGFITLSDATSYDKIYFCRCVFNRNSCLMWKQGIFYSGGIPYSLLCWGRSSSFPFARNFSRILFKMRLPFLAVRFPHLSIDSVDKINKTVTWFWLIFTVHVLRVLFQSRFSDSSASFLDFDFPLALSAFNMFNAFSCIWLRTSYFSRKFL